MMEFYKENEVNPLASCFPLLLQLPVFFALFQLLRSDEFKADVTRRWRPASFLFIPDLTEKPDGRRAVILIVLFIALPR